jgi:hypothetical protein
MKLKALVHTLLFGAALALPASARAQSALSPDGGTVTSLCKVIEVATFPNRVHVQCQYDPSSPTFYASPTSSSSEATRLVTLGSAALMGAGDLLVVWEPFVYDAASFGCLVKDCRRPTEIRLK